MTCLRSGTRGACCGLPPTAAALTTPRPARRRGGGGARREEHPPAGLRRSERAGGHWHDCQDQEKHQLEGLALGGWPAVGPVCKPSEGPAGWKGLDGLAEQGAQRAEVGLAFAASRAPAWLPQPVAHGTYTPACLPPPQGLGRSAEERLQLERTKAVERLEQKKQALQVRAAPSLFFYAQPERAAPPASAGAGGMQA